MKILEILPLFDWLALTCFLTFWAGYALFARKRAQTHPSILAATNVYRLRWMRQTVHRDPRMLDGIITQSLSETPSFFCSTTILIIGGLMALLGTTDKAAELVREIPFAQPTPMLVFEFKILVLVAIFVYAFFRFSWSMRQYTFVALMIGALPPASDLAEHGAEVEVMAQRAAAMTGLAAETFNDGLRAYYFSFAAMGWFFSPLALIVSTMLVVFILFAREFHSEVVTLLKD